MPEYPFYAGHDASVNCGLTMLDRLDTSCRTGSIDYPPGGSGSQTKASAETYIIDLANIYCLP